MNNTPWENQNESKPPRGIDEINLLGLMMDTDWILENTPVMRQDMTPKEKKQHIQQHPSLLLRNNILEELDGEEIYGVLLQTKWHEQDKLIACPNIRAKMKESGADLSVFLNWDKNRIIQLLGVKNEENNVFIPAICALEQDSEKMHIIREAHYSLCAKQQMQIFTSFDVIRSQEIEYMIQSKTINCPDAKKWLPYIGSIIEDISDTVSFLQALYDFQDYSLNKQDMADIKEFSSQLLAIQVKDLNVTEKERYVSEYSHLFTRRDQKDMIKNMSEKFQKKCNKNQPSLLKQIWLWLKHKNKSLHKK